MTRENLIFLGACSLLASEIYDANAIMCAQRLYDKVHVHDYNQTAVEPFNGPDVWIIQRHRFDDKDGKWAQSCVADGEFATELEAEQALDRWLIEEGEDRSMTFRYRVGKL